MGCCRSTAFNDHAISVASAQSFFKLEGLPLTLTVVQLDNSRLELRVLGLDCSDELKRLEAALQKRLLTLRSATLLKVGAHVDQTFELALKKKSVVPIKDYLIQPVLTHVEIAEAKFESVLEELPAASVVMRQKDGAQLFRLFVQCPLKGGERGLIAETSAKLHLSLDCASLKTLDAPWQTISDIYWMSREPSDTGPPMSPQNLCEEFKLALFTHHQSMASLSTAVKKQKSSKGIARGPVASTGESTALGTGQASIDLTQEHSSSSSDPYKAAAQEHSGISLLSRTTGSPGNDNSMTGFMHGLSKKAAEAALPIALRWTHKKLEYAIYPSSAGFVVGGFEKFVGMGLVQRSTQEMLNGKKDAGSPCSLVLEMSTFFISKKQATAAGHFAELSHMLHDAAVGAPCYSQFVTWLNLAERTWTVDRVFLNDVLPAGKGYGAEAVSEHLLAPPDLFFHTASTLSQFDSFLDSLPDLKKIVICDIINWNTYMLMAVAGCTEEEAKAKLGDVLDFALQSELLNANLTRKQLSELALLEVFQHTALGKLCTSVVKKWNAHLKRSMKMETAEVVFGEGNEEIFGQRRPRMAVIVHLATDSSGALERSKLRLANASEQLLPQVSSFQFGRGYSPLNTAEWSSALLPAAEDSQEESAPCKSLRSLEGMGEFLEEGWAEGFLDLTGQPHEGSSGSFYFASMASGMTRLMHEMQVERGLSCRAVAAAADAGEGKGNEGHVASERMRSQRRSTDKALRQLLQLLNISSALVEQGRIETRHKDVLQLQEQISIGVMVQRGLIDAAIIHPISAWMDRYLMVCSSGETAYHILIEKLLHGIVRALHFALEDASAAESGIAVAERCAILLRSKEQVGQERALLAAKGRSRWAETAGHRTIFAAIKEGSRRLANIIRTEPGQ
eukprot:s901_g7.t1